MAGLIASLWRRLRTAGAVAVVSGPNTEPGLAFDRNPALIATPPPPRHGPDAGGAAARPPGPSDRVREPWPTLSIRSWGTTSPEVQAAAFVFVLSLLARVHAFVPGFSIDDYIHVLLPQTISFDMVGAQGRPLVLPLLSFMRAFGMSPATAMPLSTLSLILALLVAGVVTCRMMGVSDRFLGCTAVIAFVSLFPYQAEMFTFRTASVLLAVPLVLLFVVMALPLERGWQWIGAVAGVVAALSIYQPVLSYASMAVVMAALHHAVKGSGRAVWRRFGALVLLLAVSLVVYLGVVWATRQWVSISNPQMGVLRLDEALHRIGQLVELGQRMLVLPEPVMPRATKLLLLLVAVLAMGTVLGVRERKFPHDTWTVRVAFLAAAVVLGVGAELGLVAVLHLWWPQPRVLAQASLFWGGLLALGLSHAGPRMRRVLLALGGLALCSFIGINHQIFSEQLRLNDRDRDLAVRILEEIEKMPDAASLRGVYLSGGRWAYDVGFQTAQGDQNISALAVRWAKTYLLMEVSGEPYTEPSAALAAQADQHCAASPRWPDARAVTRIEDHAVVCLEVP